MNLFAFIVITATLTGCNLQQIKVDEAERLVEGTVTPTATPTYDCSYFSEYDTLLDCQTTSYANCDSEWQVFPTGGTALCYFPVPGYENCGPTAGTDWIYTPYSATVCENPLLNGTYWKTRSVIGCNSAICACLTAPVTGISCSGGGCPAPTPTPMPTCAFSF